MNAVEIEEAISVLVMTQRNLLNSCRKFRLLHAEPPPIEKILLLFPTFSRGITEVR